ncbi:PD-(D/E)XK nuclease superfamily [uncultured Caudovirales phage]|uniref:PD-(D/E)XK nuclease superfamily n=1 Tax=uncultured Caudovirales phage TaxID=2100421 RepID=A0A6J5MAR0_9CAUD|nr:PD-(D/E)XK nuclease superfamily [uncultured Caudovirales phage]
MAIKKSASSTGVAKPPITAWSYSRLSTYNECPAKFKFKNIDKLPEPAGPAMARGAEIHEMADKWVKAPKEGPLPAELSQFDVEFKQLRELKSYGLQTEMQVAFTAGWKVTGWFDKDAWCRVILDAFVPADMDTKTVKPIDYKTGKIRGTYGEQMELYDLAGLILDPKAVKSVSELWFLDHGQIVDSSDTPVLRKDVPKLQKKWEGKVKRLLNDTRFDPTPSGDACKYCHFKKSNGGPCQY